MSWVFLTEEHAYKLKKPIHYNGIDFTTVARRRHNCEEEVRLNRRLAPAVYLGVLPLTCEPNGELALNGGGGVVDWLVQMRRLPAEHMLDVVLAESRVAVEEAAIRAAAGHLARFYVNAPAEPVSCPSLARRTALDLHNCMAASDRYASGAKGRVARLCANPQMDRAIEKARTHGVRVIHRRLGTIEEPRMPGWRRRCSNIPVTA